MLKGELERFIVLRDLKGLSVSRYYNYARLVSLCLIDTTIFVLFSNLSIQIWIQTLCLVYSQIWILTGTITNRISRSGCSRKIIKIITVIRMRHGPI